MTLEGGSSPKGVGRGGLCAMFPLLPPPSLSFAMTTPFSLFFFPYPPSNSLISFWGSGWCHHLF